MLEKLSKVMTSIIESFCGIVVVGQAVIIAAQVIARVLGISLPWSEELARFFLIWLTFLGCSLAIKQDCHLSVDFFVKMAPQKIRLIIGLIVKFLMILFFGIILVYGVKLSVATMSTLSTSLQWPMGLIYFVLPVSAVISIFYIFLHTVDFIKKGKEGEV